ncbi:LbetaH domain-containing protein [Halanaerobium kushneri]|uniref:Serine acetyltransferase n=1 Tax=Halanaerobium kushneri TaxID=56779 RepID=A0A1N7B5V3_9FIRM|nr:hypothetical protein [Halanaerobium kushneri]SIR46694.1 serine O-acetyltransferase [Halanaerobium kushneri]
MNTLLDKIKKDFKINSFKSGIILFFYRLRNYTFLKDKKIMLLILNYFYKLLKVILNINSQISYKAKIGSNIRMPHMGQGVVISSKSIIGNNVTIFHQVTIGINENLKGKNQEIYIGNNCYISAGAKIISSKMGDNVVVGPNAVVYKDVENDSVVLNQVLYRK